MIQQATRSRKRLADRAAIHRRVKALYRRFNNANWQECFSMIDPRLRDDGKVSFQAYAGTLRDFKECYGEVHLWLLRVNLHSAAKTNKHADRPFAYVYVIWQDAERRFHMFRERWVKESGRWYTRVVGLVSHRSSDKSPV